ncbi:MAG: tetratricopeptide repeat protein [Burkholderiales bacterium]
MALLIPAGLRAQPLYELREVAMLPPYCKHTQDFREKVPGGNSPAEIERWSLVLGDTFQAMHHYCYGLVAANRAAFSARTTQQRLYQLNASIREFDYVIERAPSNFVLLPEILWKKGESLIRLGRAPQGILELQRAIALKQDYWPPYAAISDHYKEIGDIPRAREWLQKGLSASPNTNALARRLAELDAPQSKRRPEPPAER